MRRAALLALAMLADCAPNPRNEIAGIAGAALDEARRTASPGTVPCVERTIAPWRPAGEAGRIDPPAPPGFERLLAPGVFRGGGGLKGASAGGVAIRGSPACLDLRGPLVDGDRAMIEAHVPGIGWNAWLRQTAGDWRVVMTTSSAYPAEQPGTAPVPAGPPTGQTGSSS